jgi:hypothetical protein
MLIQRLFCRIAMNMLFGMPYDLGNSPDNPPYTYRNRLIESSNILFEPKRTAFRGSNSRGPVEKDWRTEKQSSYHYGGFNRLEGDMIQPSYVAGYIRDQNRRTDFTTKVMAGFYKSNTIYRYFTPNIETIHMISDRYLKNYLDVDPSQYDKNKIDDICHDMVSGLTWVFDYYVNFNDDYLDKTNVSSWVYQYSRAPMLIHIADYLNAADKNVRKYAIVQNDNAYSGTMVATMSYLTGSERSLIINPLLRPNDTASSDTQITYEIITSCLKLSETVLSFIQRSDSPFGQTVYQLLLDHNSKEESVLILNYSEFLTRRIPISPSTGLSVKQTSPIETVNAMIPKFLFDSLKICVHPTIPDMPSKVSRFFKVIRTVMPIATIAKNIMIGISRDSGHSGHSGSSEDGVGDIDCRWAPYPDKCHLTEKHFSPPTYTDIRFMFDVVGYIVMNRTFTEGHKNVLQILKNCGDDNDQFKYVYIRHSYIRTLLSSIKSTDVEKIKGMLASASVTAIKNSFAKIKEYIAKTKEVLQDMRAKEFSRDVIESRCSTIRTDIMSNIRNIYTDDLIRTLTDSKFIDELLLLVGGLFEDQGINIDEYVAELKRVDYDITLGLFLVLVPELWSTTIALDKIYKDASQSIRQLHEIIC